MGSGAVEFDKTAVDKGWGSRILFGKKLEKQIEAEKKAAEELAAWRADSQQRALSGAAEMSASREELARLGGNKGVVEKLWRGIFPGLAEKVDQRNELSKWSAAVKTEIELNERLAIASGEVFDTAGAYVDALNSKIRELSAANAEIPKELITEAQKWGRQKVAEDYAKDAKDKADKEAVEKKLTTTRTLAGIQGVPRRTGFNHGN